MAEPNYRSPATPFSSSSGTPSSRSLSSFGDELYPSLNEPQASSQHGSLVIRDVSSSGNVNTRTDVDARSFIDQLVNSMELTPEQSADLQQIAKVSLALSLSFHMHLSCTHSGDINWNWATF